MNHAKRLLLSFGRATWQGLWIAVLMGVVHDVAVNHDPSGYRWFAQVMLIAISAEMILKSIVRDVLRHVNKVL